MTLLLFRPPKLVPDPPNFLELFRLLEAPTLEKGFFRMFITAGPDDDDPLDPKVSLISQEFVRMKPYLSQFIPRYGFKWTLV